MRLCANALSQLVIPTALRDEKTPSSMVSRGGRIFEQREATVKRYKTTFFKLKVSKQSKNCKNVLSLIDNTRVGFTDNSEWPNCGSCDTRICE